MIFKQIAVRLPRLLDKDLNEVRRLRPDTQNVSLNIAPPSTASLTLSDQSGVSVRSFIELYNAKGSVGIYRVNFPEEGFGNGDRLSLEHGICVLDDAVVRGQGKITGTPRSVLEQVLTHQTAKARGQHMWQLGVVEAPESMSITVEHDGTTTLEMLARVMTELDGYALSFSQANFPWTLHVLKKKSEVSCEGRLSRNIRTIRKTVDSSDLCTRLYCSLLDSGYIESDTIDIWGEVEQEITLNDDMPKADATAYCRLYLENRKNPAVAIEMDADEWFAMTGEKLDRFEIGDICRLALPEYGVTIEERIVAINYMDALGTPEAVTVSIANQLQDMSIKAAEMEKNVSDLQHSSAGYGNMLRQNSATIAHLKEENEGFKEVDNKLVAWFASAEINLDATEEGANVGILATYQETYDLFSDVDTRVAQAELLLHGGPDGAQAGLIARVDANAAEITATASELGTKIELKADKTYVDSLVADEIEAVVADIGLTLANNINTKQISVSGTAEVGSLKIGTMTVGTTTLPIVTEFTQALGEASPTTQITLLTVA